MHSWLQYLAPHIAHWCPSNGKVDTQCRLQRLRVLNKSRFGLLSARVMFNHCSIVQCSCDPSCLLLQLLHTPWFDTPRTPIFVDASLTCKRTTALSSHCHHCFLGYNSTRNPKPATPTHNHSRPQHGEFAMTTTLSYFGAIMTQKNARGSVVRLPPRWFFNEGSQGPFHLPL